MPINPIPKKNDEITEKSTKAKTYIMSEPLYSFDDIVLSDDTLEEIYGVISYFNNKSLIFDKWGLGKVYHKHNSICVNLHGKSGTGKTMSAHAIANAIGMKLLIVNYSEIESKYVGETSKNLVSLFEYAKRENVIILFDEADALLSKRVTSMNNATDVSVNQTRNVLLKLLDEYDGMILFTTNFLSNYDKAFLRRILFHIPFELPDANARKRLWKHYLVEEFPVVGNRENVITQLSQSDGITGADISNAVLKTAIKNAQNNSNGATVEDLLSEVEIIKATASNLEHDQFEISTRKVSGEYVKDQLTKGF